MREICREFNDMTPRDLHRLACCDRLCSIFNACKQHGHVIPRPVALRMLTWCDEFLVHYNWLSTYSVDHLRLNYQVVGKLHMFWHIVYHARYLNPRSTWCFEFEDFSGTMIQSAKGCMAGSPLLIVGAKVLDNFLMDTELRFRQ